MIEAMYLLEKQLSHHRGTLNMLYEMFSPSSIRATRILAEKAKIQVLESLKWQYEKYLF